MTWREGREGDERREGKWCSGGWKRWEALAGKSRDAKARERGLKPSETSYLLWRFLVHVSIMNMPTADENVPQTFNSKL